MEHAATKSAHASLQVPQYVLEDALEKSGPRAAQCFKGGKPNVEFWSDLENECTKIIRKSFKHPFFKSLNH